MLTLSYAPAWEPTEMATAQAAAVADLREALTGLIAEFGVPDELTLMVDVD